MQSMMSTEDDMEQGLIPTASGSRSSWSLSMELQEFGTSVRNSVASRSNGKGTQYQTWIEYLLGQRWQLFALGLILFFITYMY